jgi:hypothetical protein
MKIIMISFCFLTLLSFCPQYFNTPTRKMSVNEMSISYKENFFYLDSLFWRGKPITRKDLEDSLRITFFKYCDCVDTNKIKRKRND